MTWGLVLDCTVVRSNVLRRKLERNGGHIRNKLELNKMKTTYWFLGDRTNL